MRWFGPYRILNSFPNGLVELEDFVGKVNLPKSLNSFKNQNIK